MPTVTPLPFDPTGTNPSNKVVNEQQVITAVNFRDYHYVIPNLAPFFSDTVVMGFKNPDGTTRTLHEGVDYYYSHSFISASRACAKPIYGSIEFLFTDLAGVLTLTYQSIGGNWTLDAATIAEILANSLSNPRTTAWEQIVDLPVAFPVIDHEWDLVDMVGASEVVQALDDIRDTLSGGTSSTGLAAHLADFGNPHRVTAAQAGLGNVQNFPIATTAQAQGGTNATTYMTPLLTAQAIQALGQTNLNAHLSDFNNPHQTTKSQVNLGNVDNFLTASTAQAAAGTATNLFVTPAGVAAAIAPTAASLSGHIANTSNPHNTTKAQVLLGNVANYPPSTAQQATDGSDDASYMTPLKVAQAIAAQPSGGLAAHIADHTNPHQTTATQVNLGNVDNFSTATGADAINNSIANKFMTPQRTYAAIVQFVGTDFLAHVNNLNNPHDTTASQVGLGSVQNYGIATQTDSQNGTSNVLYMTPQGTAQAITSQIGNAFAAHVAASNPHGTTKSDVGLGNVQNFPLATTAQAQAGTDNATYMTPALTAAAITAQASGTGAALAAHLADHNNPHVTTAAQVGAYTTGQTDTLLNGKLGTGGTAANSTLFGGQSVSDFNTATNALVAADLAVFATTVVTRAVLKSHQADSGNSTGYSWAVLGTVKGIDPSGQSGTEVSGAIPDTCWMISGGEDPASTYGVTTMLQFSIRGTGGDPSIYTLVDQTTPLSSGGVDFGYVWDAPSSTATIYARMPTANNQMTVTELAVGGGSIAINYLGFTGIPTVTMMTREVGATALAAQVTQLQSDLVSGLAALTAMINGS